MCVMSAINVLERQWVSQFWVPEAIVLDPAFKNSQFADYMFKHDIEARPTPPRQHNKNVIEAMHKFIRDVYLRLKHKIPDCLVEDQKLIIQQALRVSNDICGTDVFSVHELV